MLLAFKFYRESRKQMANLEMARNLKKKFVHKLLFDVLEDRTAPSVTPVQHLVPASLNVALISDSVSQAEQVSQPANKDTIAIIYNSETMTTQGMVNLLENVSTAHSDERIGNLALVTHGSSGEVMIGTHDFWDQATLAQDADDLQQLRFVLTVGAQFDLYACSVAAGPGGKSFVNELSTDTGASIFASDKLVGTVSGAVLILDNQAGQTAVSNELFSLQEVQAIPSLCLVDRPEPASITVGTYPSGPATTVPFNTYVQDVLPNEWPSGYGWPTEAYKAARLLRRCMVGITSEIRSVRRSMCTAIPIAKYTYQAVVNRRVRQEYTDPAIAAVRSVGMETTNGQLFPAVLGRRLHRHQFRHEPPIITNEH